MEVAEKYADSSRNKTTSLEDTERLNGLIEGCRRRDAGAQHQLFDIYRDRVYTMAVFLCRNSADASEITQEVFLKLFLNIGQFHGQSKFETWLHRIVANAVTDYRRKLRRRMLQESLFWWQQKKLSPSTEEKSVEWHRRELVRSAIASLPPKLRICVVLRYIDDFSYAEIAGVLGWPPGTVAARLSRAHKILAAKLMSLNR
jgi:RNA polymerase sigma-70 factor, ECF subfamily